MKNTTISMSEQTLNDARAYARRMGCSFNAWVAGLIEAALNRSQSQVVAELNEQADKSAGDSKGEKWTRDQIYER